MNSETRDKAVVSRRDFLGTASLGMVVLSALSLFAGIFRMSKANVRYEEATKFKIGTAENFPVGTVKKLDDKGSSSSPPMTGSTPSRASAPISDASWPSRRPVFCALATARSMMKTARSSAARFRDLAWLEISRSVDGSLMVDTASAVCRRGQD